MDMRMTAVGVRPGTEPPYSIRCSDAVCETAVDEPVEHAIDGHAIHDQGTRAFLDLGVAEGGIGSATPHREATGLSSRAIGSSA